jgi:hypothetical protein
MIHCHKMLVKLVSYKFNVCPQTNDGLKIWFFVHRILTKVITFNYLIVVKCLRWNNVLLNCFVISSYKCHTSMNARAICLYCSVMSGTPSAFKIVY